MATYTYMSAASLTMIQRSYMAEANTTDPIFKLFPMREVKTPIVTWKQKDNAKGRMAFRGYNNAAQRLTALGDNLYMMLPGVYSNYVPVDETQMTLRAANTDPTTVIPIDDLVQDAFYQLRVVRDARIRQILWDLVGLSSFAVLDTNGAIAHTGSWNQRVVTSSVSWSNLTTSTPFADLLALPLQARGFSVSFGGDATLYVNRKYANYAVNNQNAADIGGKKILGGNTVNSLANLNVIMANEGIPSIEAWDGGYYDDNNVFQLNIPDGVGVLVGRRLDNAPLGQFSFTSGIGGQSSVYAVVVDKTDRSKFGATQSIEVHEGFSGGPEIHYGNGCLRMAI